MKKKQFGCVSLVSAKANISNNRSKPSNAAVFLASCHCNCGCDCYVTG